MKIPERLDNKRLFKTLKKQMLRCIFYSKFRSCVFISLRFKKNIVFEYLRFLCENHWLIKRNVHLIRNNMNETSVQFKNGSIIRVVPCNTSARGYRMNNAIIDDDITNPEILNCIIRPMITGYLIIPPKPIDKIFKTKLYYRKWFKHPEIFVNI